MKSSIRIAIAIGALGLAAIASLFVYFDAVAGAVIRRGASEALGVETRVGWVRFRPLVGEFQTGRVEIANPPGFETPHFLQLSSGEFDVALGSLTEDVIEVPRLELDGIDVYLEGAHGKTNYGSILNNLNAFKRRVGGTRKGSEGSAGSSGSVALIIRELVIRDIRAHIDSGKLRGGADRVAVDIPEIRLTNIGTAGSGGASIAEVFDTVVRGVLIAVAKRAPADLVRGLKARVGTLGSVLLEVPNAGDAGSFAERLGDGAGKVLKKFGGLLKRE